MAAIDLLILDADDTLWESGLFFERTEYDFLSLMEALGHPRAVVRSIVHRLDVERLALTGFGARPYIDTLRTIMNNIAPSPPLWVLDAMNNLEQALLYHPLILLRDVYDTMVSLKEMSIPMIIYTMGEADHQLDKFSRSGLTDMVDECRVVPVKTVESLQQLLLEKKVNPSTCIFVGNSPRSDINPALANGVRAVHVAKDRTWAAEREDFADPGSVLTIENFSELLPIIGSVLSE